MKKNCSVCEKELKLRVFRNKNVEPAKVIANPFFWDVFFKKKGDVDFSQDDSIVGKTIYEYLSILNKCRLCPDCIVGINNDKQLLIENNLSQYAYLYERETNNSYVVKLFASFIYFKKNNSWLNSTGDLSNLEELKEENDKMQFSLAADALLNHMDNNKDDTNAALDAFANTDKMALIIAKEKGMSIADKTKSLCKKYKINHDYFISIQNMLQLND